MQDRAESTNVQCARLRACCGKQRWDVLRGWEPLGGYRSRRKEGLSCSAGPSWCPRATVSSSSSSLSEELELRLELEERKAGFTGCAPGHPGLPIDARPLGFPAEWWRDTPQGDVPKPRLCLLRAPPGFFPPCGESLLMGPSRIVCQAQLPAKSTSLSGALGLAHTSVTPTCPSPCSS